MAEPMEETRSTITFATEPVTASLRSAIAASASAHDSSRRGGRAREDDELELDEVEIQKGLSQLAKGLQFLHESAKLVHGNLTPDAVIINAKGDWKLSGFGVSTYLFGPDGVPAKWEFPEYDHSLPPSLQRDYDYIAPEYILDESSPAPSNDMYSLGCILHSIHTHSGPPFSNRNSLANARTNMEDGLSRGMVRPQWRKLSEEVQDVLSQLITRYPSARLTAAGFLAHGYFSSLLVSTLNFISRDHFASQTSEAQAGFLKGLITVLPRFSDKVNRRKVLPSLLEETRKANLVPFLLPNVLYIAAKMDTESFRAEVLPSLKPLFLIKDPPQAVIALLDNLQLFIEKCSPAVFRDEVMPLIYAALESENPVVLERALKVVPGLSETLDYTTVKQTLFPKITAVFTKTTMLSVKVNTLICFHSMIKTLDKFTLTEKLVPLLAKIKTKEPAVMIATLAVHEAMGSKVEIESIATLILPQLWAMSMGPLLNASQFAKFMSVIKRLGTRVEEEHSRQLGELRRLEESSGAANGRNGEVVMDFESLVRGGGLGANGARKEVANDMWGDDSPTRSLTPSTFSPSSTPAITPNTSSTFSAASTFGASQHSRPSPTPRLSASAASSSRPTGSLGARPVPPASFNASAFSSSSHTQQTSPPLPALPSFASSHASHTASSPILPPSHSQPTAAAPSAAGLRNFAALQPSPRGSTSSPAPPTSSMATMSLASSNGAGSSSSYGSGRPNYDLGSPAPSSSVFGNASSTPSYMSSPALSPSASPAAAATPSWNPAPPPGFAPGGVLQPKSVAPKSVASASFGAWKDFDPLG